jgi:very-short-patch-repair endonuclease
MGYYCSVCRETITERVYTFSMDKFGKALCMTHQKMGAAQPRESISFNQPQFHTPQTNTCSVCRESISGQVYNFSMNHFGAALCMNHQKTVTPQAIKLSNALKDLDVKHKLEYSDGYKHVDIAIESAKLYLELDGTKHGFSPKQMSIDDERDRYSHRGGYDTKRIPNAWVDKNVDRLAASIAVLVNKRQYEIREQAKKITLTGIMKTVISTARKLSQKLEDFE